MRPLDYFTFFRWKNLLMIVLMQYLLKYVLFEQFDMIVALDHVHFALLCLSTLFVATAGYIINDINDVKADIINKPDRLFIDKKITRINAHYLFLAFNALGMILGMYLSYYVGHTSYFIIYVLTSLLLYQYAKYLKKYFLIGNLIVSFSVFLSVLLVLVFDLLPVTSDFNFSTQFEVYKIILFYGGYSFLLTLIREVIKDCEDVKGDKAMELRTLPLVLGIAKTKWFIIVLSAFTLLTIVVLALYLYQESMILSIYLGMALVLPLVFVIYKTNLAKNKVDFHRLSSVLKLIMLTGVLSLLII